jgi:hypothetical protein
VTEGIPGHGGRLPRGGVKIYADAVINHMAGGDAGTGWAGSA